MAVWSNTSLSEISESFGRLDAEFFRPEYLNNDHLLEKLPLTSLRTVASKIDVGHVGSMVKHYTDDGVLLLQTQNVKEFFLDLNHTINITPGFHDRLNKSRIRRGDILIARSGSFGSAAVYLEDEEINSADIIIVNAPEGNGIDPLFLVAFMNSRFGSTQLVRFASGGVQGHVNLKILEHFKIPKISDANQSEIADLVRLAYSERKTSEGAYTQAQQLLESELGLDKLRFDKPVGYTARFSELELSRRFDSEHYYPAFDNLKTKLPKGVGLVPLGPLLTFCQRGKQPIYSEHGLPVLNSKHVLENKITLEGNRYAKPNPVPSLQIQHGDVLINGTGRGTIGRAAPYLTEEHQAMPDNHVTILRSPTLDPTYLSFYLNSLAGKLQVEKHQRGSSGQLELYPFDIRKFEVWEAPQTVQHEIRRLYEQATESAKQSRELLDQAKSRVEQLIEEAVRA